MLGVPSSSCGEQELLSSCGVWASHCCGFSGFRARVLGWVILSSCGTFAHSLWRRGFSCSMTCGILPGQGQTHVPSIGRALHHWPTREAPQISFLNLTYASNHLSFVNPIYFALEKIYKYGWLQIHWFLITICDSVIEFILLQLSKNH